MSLSLLVVEDDPVNMDVLKRYLGGKGFRVTGAGSAEDALALLDTASFDGVLLDNVLPGMTGLQALGEIIAKTAAPVLLMTGHADEEMRKDAMLLGAKAFLYKPFDFALLAKILEDALAQK
ncbi:MAG: response regulator [Elusimicrobia bacterium]|nr:response regulator [Elusimicrobiota bacterium]